MAMVTSYREAPLIFLNSSGPLAPTGRNARTQARSDSAKRSNPANGRGGSFGSFTLNSKGIEDTRHSSKRLKIERAKADYAGPAALCSPVSLRIMATHFHGNSSVLPPSVNFEDVLKVAAFHIRRRAASIVSACPERTLDALRCRQWCSISSTSASLGRSAYLDSAIACVVAKVQQVISGEDSQQRMLLCYTEALTLLRQAVVDTNAEERSDILAAMQLLAVYEMLDLDFPSNGAWALHVSAATAIAKLGHSNGVLNQQSIAPAAPMFVEALVSNDDSFFESRHWTSLLHTLSAKRNTSSDVVCETVSCLTALRSLFAQRRAALSAGCELVWSIKLALLSQAHELRARIKSLIIEGDQELVKIPKTSQSCDILGLLLISLIILDRLILSLRDGTAHRGTNLEEDTQGLCNQMARMELDTSDHHPGKELLLALRRQVNYPSLPYGL